MFMEILQEQFWKFLTLIIIIIIVTVCAFIHFCQKKFSHNLEKKGQLKPTKQEEKLYICPKA